MDADAKDGLYKQQTALSWFIEQLEEKGDLRETPSIRIVQINIDTSEYLDLKRQAKAMEKNQILNTWYACKLSIIDRDGMSIEDYYNKTYTNGL